MGARLGIDPVEFAASKGWDERWTSASMASHKVTMAGQWRTGECHANVTLSHASTDANTDLGLGN